jgi:hypothetical protein
MITVLIATKGRPAKLARCLASIPRSIPVAIHATCREDLYIGDWKDAPMWASTSTGPENIVQAFNLLAHPNRSIPGSYLLPVPDDVRFAEGFFDHLQSWASNHPEQQVIGCPVTNRKHNDDAVTLVHRSAIDARGYLFDPRFEHFFIDYELGRWAKQRKVFGVCPQATLEHFHPEVSGEYDDTHRHRRMDKWRHDKAIWDQIRGKGPAPAAATAQM